MAFALGLGACSPIATPTPKLELSPPQRTTPEISLSIIASPTTVQSTTEPIVTATAAATKTVIPLTPTPTPTPSPLPCTSAEGSIEIQQINSSLLEDPLVFRVYLPPCYDQQPNLKYPSLYLLHGQTYTDDQWDHLGIDEVANSLISNKQIPAMIIIMPGEQDQHNPPPDNPYGEAITKELIPYIDKTYRTIANREHRAIGGLSRGGNWAIHLGISQWTLFGSIGAHSTPTFVTDGPSRIRDMVAAIPRDKLPRIYMDVGVDDGWRQYTFQLETVLTEEKIPHEWFQFQGTHDEDYWSKHIADYLLWYAQSW